MIKVSLNSAEVEAVFARISAHLTDMSPLMNEIGNDLLSSTQQRFATESGPDGIPWAPRSPVTIARYNLKGQNFGPILHKRGDLGQDINFQYDERSVTVGSPTPYAAVMQFGAAQHSLGPKSPWGNIPARPFIGLSTEDRDGILDAVQHWLQEAVGG